MIIRYVFFSILLCIGLLNNTESFAQCTPCGSPTTFNVDLSANPDTTFTMTSTRSGLCCGASGTNCIRFDVTINASANEVSFNVANPAPPGGAFYQVNCGPPTSLGTPLCVTGMTTFCIVFCKSGGDSPTYTISSARTFAASPDITLNSNCTDAISIAGLQEPTITWNSIFPGAIGAYNSYLSCTSSCDTTYVTPQAGYPPYIDYVACGTATGCSSGTSCDTVRVSIVPGLVVNIDPATATICSGNPITLTANITGGNAPYSYLWSPGGQTSSAISVSVQNTYIVSVSDSTNCPAVTDTIVVGAAPSPSPPDINSNSPICEGATLNLTASVVLGATYSWTGPNGFTSTLQNPSIPAATLAASGTYTLSIIVAGCTSNDTTTTVVVNPIPATPTASSNSPICANSTLNLTTPFVAGASYSWTGPNGFSSALQNPSIASATVAASGTYNITITVAGCTSAAGTTSATVNPTPAAPTASSNSPICANSTLNLTTPFVAGASYSWTGPNGFSSALQNPSIASATIAATGTYNVTITVAGCTSPAGSTSVTVNPIPATPTASSNSPVCQGTAINLTTPLVAGATYSWTGPNGFSSALQNPSIASALLASAGTYNITVTVLGCTSAAGSTTVVVNPTPATPTASSNSPICANSTLNLSTPFVAGASYSWTGPNGFSSALQNPSIASATVAATGTYNVTITVTGCTSASGSTSVTVNPIPATPTASSNSPVCQGTAINLTTPLVAGATYSWTGPNGFSSALQNPSIAAALLASAGTYNITVTVLGCTSAAGSTTVVVNPTPATPTASSNSPICANSTLNLTTPFVAGGSYSWTGPNGFSSALQNPSIASALLASAGTYNITVTVLGCTSAAGSTTVVVNPTPATPTASSNSPICANSTLNLSTPFVAGASYSWTGPNGFSSALQNPSIASATVAATGTYNVTITVTGCTSASGSTSVTVNPIPATPTASSNSPVCQGTAINLTTPLVAGATYSWTGPNGFSSALQNPSIAAALLASAGTYNITVTVLGCTSAAGSTTVVVNPTPATPTASSNSPICANSTLNLSTPFVAGASYSWTGPNGFSSILQNPSIASATVAASGTYNVTITVTGCGSAAGSTAVTVNPTPTTPTATNNGPLCVGQTLNLTTPFVAGASYSWTGPNGFSSILQNPSVSNVVVADGGVYSVTVTVAGCTSPAGTTTVIVNTPPITPTVSSNSPVCTGTPLNLTTPFVAGGSYSWTGPNGFSSTLQNPSIGSITLAGAGVYSLTVTVGICVSPVGTTTVVVNPTPVIATATNNGPLCVGATLNLTASNVAGASYSWTGPNGFTSILQNPSIPSVTLLEAGVYSVTATLNGCTSAPKNTTLVVNQPSVALAGSDQTVCANNSLVTLSGSVTGGSSTGIWTTSGTGIFSPNDTNLTPTYTPSSLDSTNGSVTLTLTTTNNGACVADVSTLIITISPAPLVNAGIDVTVCGNNAVVNLAGSVTGGTTTGVWTTSGTGTFVPSNTTLNAVYTPSAAEITAGTVTLTLTSTNNGTCFPVSDQLVITITPSPVVNAGTNVIVCQNSPNVLLAGSVTGGTITGQWSSSGTGTFNPSTTTLNATYTPSPADISAGTVTLILVSTNNGNCIPVSDTIIVTITSSPIVDAGSNVTICANNVVNLSGSVIGFTTTGQWTTSGSGTFSPNNTDMNAIYVPSSADTTAGSVTITLTSTNNASCIPESDQLTITFTSAPTVNAGTDIIVCANNPIANLSGTVSAPFTGLWSTFGTGTFTPNNTDLNASYNLSSADTSAGLVTLILESANNGTCLTEYDTVLITLIASPIANAGTDQYICIGDNGNLAGIIINGSGTGQWSSSGTGTFTPSNTTLNATYNPSAIDYANGSVSIVLISTNNGACLSNSDTATLFFTTPPTVSAGSNLTICENENAQLAGVVSGTSTTGQWITSGDGTFIPNNTDLNAQYVPGSTDIINGSVTITLQSTFACLATDQITITINPGPQADAGLNQIICITDNQVALSGIISGNTTTGIWTTSGTGSFTPVDTVLNATYNLTPADSALGSFMLILTSTNNGSCLAVSDTIIITLTTIPVVNAGVDTTFCANNFANLNGTITGGASSGIWSTSGSGTFAPINTDLNALYSPSSADVAAGFVNLTLTSTGACVTISDIVTITISPSPFVFAGNDTTICDSSNLQLNGIISGGASTGLWTSSGDGNFIPSNTALNALYNPGPIDLLNGSFDLYLQSTNNGDCIAEDDTLSILILSAPTADAGIDQIVCGSSNVNLSGIITGGSGGQWSTLGTGTFNNPLNLNTDYNPSNADTAAGSVQLILTSDPLNSCGQDMDTILITFMDIPMVNAGLDYSVCANNDTISLAGLTSSGAGFWTTTGDGMFIPSDSLLITNYIPGSQDELNGQVIFELTPLNLQNCPIVIDSIVVTISPTPVVDAGADISVCLNNLLVSLNGSVTGGSSTGVWTTNGTGTFIPDSIFLNTNYLPSNSDTTLGLIWLALTSTNNGSCLAESDTLIVTFDSAPIANAGLDFTTCQSDTALLVATVSGGGTTIWTTSGLGAFTPDSASLSVGYIPNAGDTAAPVEIILTYTNGCGSVMDTVYITVLPSPIVSMGYTVDCATFEAQFDAIISGGTIQSVYWDFGDGGSDTVISPSHIYATDGTYNVLLFVTTTDGCNDSISQNINIEALPIADFDVSDSVIIIGNTIFFNDTSTNVSSWEWDFGDLTGSYFPEDTNYTYSAPGTYTVLLIVYNNSGCSDTATIQIIVEPNDDDVEIPIYPPAIPTAFTPNGDGFNDMLFVRGGPFESFDLRVYNEWGNELFMASDQDEGWDGTYKGNEQPAGTYMYLFEGTTIDGTKYSMASDFSLIR